MCEWRYYWHIDTTTGAQSTSTWTSFHELRQQEQQVRQQFQAAATSVAAAAFTARIERGAMQEVAYRKKLAYGKGAGRQIGF